MISPLSERLYLTIIITCAAICLLPLLFIETEVEFNLDDISMLQQKVLFDNHQVLQWASLFVVVIPAADLLLDVPHYIVSYIYRYDAQKIKRAKTTGVSRLSDMERALFIVGVAARSVMVFLPDNIDARSRNMVYDSTTNCSNLLILGPVAIFLGRCTTTFTPLRTFAICFLSGSGLALLSIASLLRSHGSTYRAIQTLSLFFLSASAILYLALACFCFFKYLRQCHDTIRSGPESFIKTFRKLLKELLSPMSLTNESSEKSNEILYSCYIPALHMMSTLMISFATLCATYLPSNGRLLAEQQRSWLTLGAEIIVLVIELRIRKNEVSRGLVSSIA